MVASRSGMYTVRSDPNFGARISISPSSVHCTCRETFSSLRRKSTSETRSAHASPRRRPANAHTAMNAAKPPSAARMTAPTSLGAGIVIAADALRVRGSRTRSDTSRGMNRSRTAARITFRTFANRVRTVVGAKSWSCMDLTHTSTCETRNSSSATSPNVTDAAARSIACRVPDTHT
ncbi:MAG: hypothetical protein ACRDT5_24555 [Mycobacterium sp.]